MLIVANAVYQLHSLSHSRLTADAEVVVEEPSFTLPHVKLITLWI